MAWMAWRYINFEGDAGQRLLEGDAGEPIDRAAPPRDIGIAIGVEDTQEQSPTADELNRARRFQTRTHYLQGGCFTSLLCHFLQIDTSTEATWVQGALLFAAGILLFSGLRQPLERDNRAVGLSWYAPGRISHIAARATAVIFTVLAAIVCLTRICTASSLYSDETAMDIFKAELGILLCQILANLLVGLDYSDQERAIAAAASRMDAHREISNRCYRVNADDAARLNMFFDLINPSDSSLTIKLFSCYSTASTLSPTCTQAFLTLMGVAFPEGASPQDPRALSQLLAGDNGVEGRLRCALGLITPTPHACAVWKNPFVAESANELMAEPFQVYELGMLLRSPNQHLRLVHPHTRRPFELTQIGPPSPQWIELFEAFRSFTKTYADELQQTSVPASSTTMASIALEGSSALPVTPSASTEMSRT